MLGTALLRSSALGAALLLASAARAEPAGGRDFAEQARALYRVVACTGTDPLAPNVDAAIVAAYCKKMSQHMATYRKTYVEEASAFIAKAKPANLPTTVVYPFGGGDLLSALTTYPDATDITTLSLEHVGDPLRFLATKDKKKQSNSLDLVRRMTGGLLLYNDSKTESLQKMMRGEIPGNLAFFLIALGTHGYEPVSLRYFQVQSDGTLKYLEQADIDALEKKNAKLLHSVWVAPDFSEAYSNAEIGFRKIGDTTGPIRYHRHMAANLINERLNKDDGVLKYLSKKGTVSSMTKAASYLLWRDDFSRIRDYLLDHSACLVSDSTGVPPKFGLARGFVYETYGRFKQSFLGANGDHNAAFRKLWDGQPYRALPFRYGYIDGSEGKHYHMVIMKPGPKTGLNVPAGGPRWVQREAPVYRGEGPPQPGEAKPWLPRELGGPAALLEEDHVDGGPHQRIMTSFGAAHLWRPVGYDVERAGIVFYLHGYWVNVDQAFWAHHLAAQFRDSGRNALFVVPESPSEDADPVFVRDPNLLLDEVRRASLLPLPQGPWVVVAHSGGFRTVATWLTEPRVTQINLLDGLYNALPAFGAWAQEPGRRLLLIGLETADRGERLARRTPGGVRRKGLPESPAAFTPEEAQAPLLAVRTELEHMAMVLDGQLVPFVLGLSSLEPVAES